METIRVSSALLDREDLDIYTKMCCILLVKAAQEERESSLGLEELAGKMGCTVKTAGSALEKLVKKGLLIEEPSLELTELKEEARRVRKKDRLSPAATFEAFDAPPKLSVSKQLEALRTFIHEPATDGTLKIVLNMGQGDIERIKGAYRSAAAMETPDTLDTMMHLLQHPGGTAEMETRGTIVTPTTVAPIVKKEESAQTVEPVKEVPTDGLEPGTRQVITQINQKRIAELYNQGRKKPQK